jgi:hypothetical protein
MNIEFSNDPEKKNSIDTNKQSDANALVYEKMEELKKLFGELKIPYLMNFITQDKKLILAHCFFHSQLDLDVVRTNLCGEMIKKITEFCPKWNIEVSPKDEYDF